MSLLSKTNDIITVPAKKSFWFLMGLIFLQLLCFVVTSRLFSESF